MSITRNQSDLSQCVSALEAMAGNHDFAGDGAHSATTTVTQFELAQIFNNHLTSSRVKVTSAFEQVAAVNRCIQILADAVKSMPLMISTADDQIVESGDIIDTIMSPYPGMTGEDLVEWITALLPLTGSANLIKGDAAGNVAPPGIAARSLRPVGGDRCRPQYDLLGHLEGYRYYPPGARNGRPLDLLPNQVIRWTRSNYQSQRFADGLAALQPAKAAIEQVYAADIANLSNLMMGPMPGVHLNLPNEPTGEQITAFRQHIKDMHSGPDRAGEPIITWGNAKVEPFSKDFSKMLHDRLKMMSIVDICVALGVPPIILGYTGEAGLGHGKETEEANRIFWVTSVLPLAHWIARRITIDVLPAYAARSFRWINRTTGPMSAAQRACPTYQAARIHARGFRVPMHLDGKMRRQPTTLFAWFDASKVPAIIESQFRLVEKGRILIEAYEVPPADVIEAHDLPYQVHPHQRIATRPIGRIPVTEHSPLSDEATGVNDVDLETEETERSQRGGCCGDHAGDIDLPAEYREVGEETLRGIWESWFVSWAPLRIQAEGRIKRHWMKRRAEVLAKLRAAGRSAGGASKRVVIAEILFDVTIGSDGTLAAALRTTIKHAVQLGGEQIMDEAAADQGKPEPAPFDMQAGDVIRALRRREVRINTVEREMRERLRKDADQALRDAIAEGLDQGQTTAKIADAIRERFNIEVGKAGMVARTEVGSAVEEARHVGRRQAQVPLKSWLSSRKTTGRPNHLAVEVRTLTNPIPAHEEFEIPETGGRCQYPRASTLDAADVVNCTCTVLNRYPDDNLRSVAERYARRGFLMPDGTRTTESK